MDKRFAHPTWRGGTPFSGQLTCEVMLAKVELRLLTTKDRLGCEPYRVRKARTRSTTPYSPGPNQSVLLRVDTCTQQHPPTQYNTTRTLP